MGLQIPWVAFVSHKGEVKWEQPVGGDTWEPARNNPCFLPV